MNNMNFVRIWLYKSTEVLSAPDCKTSKTNQNVKKVIRGDFKFYKVDGKNAYDATRKEAKKWAAETGSSIDTLMGYPAWMHDLGYRV